MHFFGTLGTICFLAGFIITVYVIGDKLYTQYYNPPARDIVNQPMFFLALVALIVGMQLFLAGFLAEILLQTSPTKNDYLISETVNRDHQLSLLD